MTTLPEPPRGLVVPLTRAQIVYRARYLAGLLDSSGLDPYVRLPLKHLPIPLKMRTIYYRLPDHNGGKDPTALDPADDWFEAHHHRITCDCSGGNAWIHGYDRLQEKRMAAAVGYKGYWNTNSQIKDATRIVIAGSAPRCFVAEDRPFIGAIVVCKSGAPRHKVGHQETVIEIPAEWAPKERECWEAIKTAGVSNRKIKSKPSRANMPGTARGFHGTGALFLRSVMVP